MLHASLVNGTDRQPFSSATFDNGVLTPYPVVREGVPMAPSGEPMERVKIHLGKGQYKVVEGYFLTPGLVSLEEAERICAGGRPNA